MMFVETQARLNTLKLASVDIKRGIDEDNDDLIENALSQFEVMPKVPIHRNIANEMEDDPNEKLHQYFNDIEDQIAEEEYEAAREGVEDLQQQIIDVLDHINEEY